MRLQLDIDTRKVDTIRRLEEVIGATTHKELFNNALSLLDWAVKQRRLGRIIAAVDEKAGIYLQLTMPALDEISVSLANTPSKAIAATATAAHAALE